MQPTVLTKLAYQIATYYEQCQTFGNAGHLKGSLNKKWPQYFETKIAIYKAIAQYQLGLERGQADGFGEQVARYAIAYRLLEEEKKRKILPELQELFNQVHAVRKQSRICNV